MPVSFLAATQRERYGHIQKHFPPMICRVTSTLDDDDREWIARKRRDSCRG